MTTREQQDGPAAACRACKQHLPEKVKFCDSCGTATTALAGDWETLQHYCGRCGSVLRGTKKHCSSCGEASAAHAPKKAKHDSWLFNAAEDPKIQIAAVAVFVFLASVPLLFPVRYGLSAQPPFFLVPTDEALPVDERVRAPFATLDWSGRSLVTDEPLAASGVARAADGSYYVSDAAAHVVYRIAQDGTQTVAAGSGEAGYAGDGGSAVAAQLNTPLGLTIDQQGNLYIADSANGRVRVVDPDGVIRTIAGCASGCSGDDVVQAAALSLEMTPEDLSFVGSNLLVAGHADESSPDSGRVWVLQPEE